MPSSSPKPRRRWWKLLLVGLPLATMLPIGIYRFNEWNMARELREVIEEIYRTDPSWRLEDIERLRKVIAHEANGAQVLLTVSTLVPGEWVSNPLWLELHRRPPAVRLWKGQVQQLEAALQLVGAAI